MRQTVVIAAAGGVLLLGILALAQKRQEMKEGPMTREGAVRMAKAFLEAQGIRNSPGLNDRNLGGAGLLDHQLVFEYVPEKNVLKASAMVYRFNQPPKPGVIPAFQDELHQGTDAGGGTVEYTPENRCLVLTRTYAATVADRRFIRDMERLARAAAVWGDEVFDRVASRVFHPEELKQRR